MGIEVSTYISGLTSTWPPSGDPKSQGDDHLRLIKSVLQSTFPNASKPFYFPSAVVTGALTLTAAHAGAVVYATTASGDVTITLPAGLGAADTGWSVEVVKYEFNSNAGVVVPASGTITTQCGNVASVRIGSVALPVRFIWSGSGWMAVRSGPMIGTTLNCDGVVPWGFMALDGSTFSAATFAELALALGTTTLRDKRGRTEIGAGTGSGLTARVAGTTYGAETTTLAAANIPSLSSSGSNPITVSGTALNQNTDAGWNVALGSSTIFGFSSSRTVSPITSTGNNNITVSYANASPTAIGQLQPSIGVNKVIRAC